MLQDSCAAFIVNPVHIEVVDRSIQLDDPTRLCAIEVHDERPNRVLTAESRSGELAVSQVAPQ